MTNTQKSLQASPQIIPRPEHTVTRANISRNALKVLYRLKDGGYQAFLVGGSVRDLLLGRHPKDFDIATDARPEEVRALFNNSRLIGRRFRLAHVRFGRDIIEVATFRGGQDQQQASEHRQVAETSGRILRDNVYGSLEEDIWRRDFTANALYYNIADFSIYDFAGGVGDIRARQLRLIGDPDLRYREDPVRMLRAARFAAKLGFDIDRDTAAPIPRLGNLIDGVPAARLFDEFGKLFQAGFALESFRCLCRLRLFEHLFPHTAAWLADDPGSNRQGFLESALKNTDQRVAAGKPVTPMFLFGVFLWGPVSERANALVASDGLSEPQALIAASSELVAEQNQRISLPKRFSFPMREVLQIQPRFERRRGRRAQNLLSHRRFRAAYDLMLLRVALGEVDGDTAAWWTEVQTLTAAEQHREFGIRHRRKPRRRALTPSEGSP